MDESTRYRTLVETDEYFFQLEDFAQKYSDEILDAALMAVLWGIATNPEQYDRVTWNIFIAKSRSFNPMCPRFQIIFSLLDDGRVLLRWIEEIKDEESAILDL